MAGTVLRRRSVAPFDPFTILRDSRTDFWIPVADVFETDDAWKIELELPGVSREDIDVEVHGRRLSVRGERPERETEGTVRRRTRVTGRFEYSVTLGTAIDVDSVSASLVDGVLTVDVAKHATDQPRAIEIH